jgi:3-dehydroquinate synthase
METIVIEGRSGRSRILVGENIDHLSAYLPERRRVILITDEIVGQLYGDRFPAGEVITVGCGEQHKTLETLAAIYDRLIALEADRSVFLVGIGGGIVGDITGFAASTFMRGVRFGFVPTTLLAQVDATVGGKNGVNFKGFKNMIGVFNQPDFVVADIEVLSTLPPEHIAGGLAEIVKHGCIADISYLEEVENNCAAIAALDRAVMTRLVSRSVQIKAAVVNQDEKETGERRKLNFGHTLGHAIEKTLGISHGHAVSVGMVLASEFARDKGLLPENQVDRLKRLLTRLNLPIRVQMDRHAVFDALKKDKKREDAIIHFVFLSTLGRAVVQPVAIAELGQWLLGGGAGPL